MKSAPTQSCWSWPARNSRHRKREAEKTVCATAGAEADWAGAPSANRTELVSMQVPPCVARLKAPDPFEHRSHSAYRRQYGDHCCNRSGGSMLFGELGDEQGEQTSTDGGKRPAPPRKIRQIEGHVPGYTCKSSSPVLEE